MAIIAILAAIVVPSLNSALERAKATKDLSNLRQIGALMQTYLNDKDGVLPVIRRLGRDWHNRYARALSQIHRDADTFSSRLSTSGLLRKRNNAPVSYGINSKHVCSAFGNRWQHVESCLAVIHDFHGT